MRSIYFGFLSGGIYHFLSTTVYSLQRNFGSKYILQRISFFQRYVDHMTWLTLRFSLSAGRRFDNKICINAWLLLSHRRTNIKKMYQEHWTSSVQRRFVSPAQTHTTPAHTIENPTIYTRTQQLPYTYITTLSLIVNVINKLQKVIH